MHLACMLCLFFLTSAALDIALLPHIGMWDHFVIALLTVRSVTLKCFVPGFCTCMGIGAVLYHVHIASPKGVWLHQGHGCGVCLWLLNRRIIHVRSVTVLSGVYKIYWSIVFWQFNFLFFLTICAKNVTDQYFLHIYPKSHGIFETDEIISHFTFIFGG